MKLFELQTDMISYTYPIIKIIVCISIILFGIERDRFFLISNLWVEVLVKLIFFQLTIASILCLYISIGEMFHTYSNRRSVNCKNVDVKLLPVKEIIEIVSRDDIVEIEACVDNKTITIGASADCKPSSSIFEDKLFYISSSEYETMELFVDALNSLFPKGEIPVFRIDGLPLD